MRDYAKVAPQFWTGRTGKALKAAGPEAVIVGMYLMTSPHANMIGVYHCPVAYIAIDTGLTLEGASKGLQRAIEADFCTFEADTEYVFVHAFAEYQIGAELDPKDLRCKGVAKELEKVPKGQCWQGFRARYAVPFNLPAPAVQASPLQAPSKPGTGTGTGTGAKTGTRLAKTSPAVADATTVAPTAEVWKAYAEAYENRYGATPVRNAKGNGQLAQFVARIGADEGPAVARFYVGHQGQFYVRAMHSTDLLLRDAEKLRTEWATGRGGVEPAHETDYARAMREKIEQISPRLAAKRTGVIPEPFTIEMEPDNGPCRIS